MQDNKKTLVNKSIPALAMLVVVLVLLCGVLIVLEVQKNIASTFPKRNEHYELAAFFLADGKFEIALQQAELSLQIDPKDADSYLLRADILERLGRHDQSLADLHKVGELKPELAVTLHQQAYHVIENDGSPEEVVRLETMALNIAPRSPKSYINRSYAEDDLKQFDKAIADCTAGLALKPAEDSVLHCLYLNRANAYNGSGNFPAAYEDYKQASRVKEIDHQSSLQTMQAGAEALIGIKKYADADALCKKAIALIEEAAPEEADEQKEAFTNLQDKIKEEMTGQGGHIEQ